MKTRAVAVGMLLATLLTFSTEAFSWGNATHTYINDNLGRKGAFYNTNEIYGGLAPDIFGFMFDDPALLQYLNALTHEHAAKVWDAARTKTEKAIAYGFVSHNEKWGIDLTAHKSGLTYGTADGYIIAKANELLALAPLPPELMIPDEIARVIYHYVVEIGVDIIVKEHLDRHVGQKMAAAALLRSPEVGFLLARAYGDEIATAMGLSHADAAMFITRAEREFRNTIVLYGQALTQNAETTVTLLSEQMVDLAEAFLGQPLPLDREAAVVLVSDLVSASMWLCADDFAGEIEATITFVGDQLKRRGFKY
jgi:hypothetical protein